MTRRPTKPCSKCPTLTRSATGTCWHCRESDDPPPVHVVNGGRMIAFAGLTLTRSQARTLADRIHDTLDEQENR